MKNLIWLLLSCVVLSCQSKKPAQENIADKSDYAQYLQESDQQTPIDRIDTDLEFWGDKLVKSPNNFTYISRLAGLYSRKFRMDGKVEHIYTSDSLYRIALERNPFSKAGLYMAFSSNSIIKHEFAQAKNYAELALKEGDKQTASYYLLFDALMELAEYPRAKAILAMQSNKSTFDYLIRASKLADREGDLDKAIVLMEKAFERVKSNPSSYAWSRSNLADMYGHAGRVEEAYQAYLDVLEKDPQHLHSLQGIAWIAFAHDHDTAKAKEILNYVKTQTADPQVTLMLSEIADYEQNDVESRKLKESYYAEVTSPQYLGMYNKYLILLEAEDLSKPEVAVKRANAEQKKRPTAEMYDLLAWSYYQNGDNEKALSVANSHVENKTSEPTALYHLGVIYKMNNLKKKGNSYLKRALESSFELGPLTTNKIKEALKS